MGRANGFGTPQLVDPYNDPYWDDVINGSPPTGTTYQGNTVDFYNELSNVTGMFYANGFIYYTLSGNSHLFSRAFSPDTQVSTGTNQVTGGVISPVKNTVNPASGSVDFSGAGGMFVAAATSGTRPGLTGHCTRSHGTARRSPARAPSTRQQRATGRVTPCSSLLPRLPLR